MNAETEYDAEIEAGGNGQFDVVVDGALIFSKQEAGRFPDPGEVQELLPPRP